MLYAQNVKKNFRRAIKWTKRKSVARRAIQTELAKFEMSPLKNSLKKQLHSTLQEMLISSSLLNDMIMSFKKDTQLPLKKYN